MSAEYAYDEVTDLFNLDGHPVPRPDPSPESEDEWEDWRIAHHLDEAIWEECSLPADGPALRRRHHHAEPGNVSWDGISDDAADSQADDLEDTGPAVEPCGECGWDGHAGRDHASYTANIHGETHAYLPAPAACSQGSLIISLTGVYENEDYTSVPDEHPELRDKPSLTLHELWGRPGDDSDAWWWETLKSGLTVDQATDLAADKGGGLIGT